MILMQVLVDFIVALAASAVTSFELAVTSCLVRRSMVAESVVTMLLSAAVAVARLAIASEFSVSLSTSFA